MDTEDQPFKRVPMRYPCNVVDAGDTRQHNGPNQCGYCKGMLGGPHDPGCVCIDRPVKIQITIDLVVVEPRDWDAHMIELHLNESSSCKDNLLDEITRNAEAAGCLCGLAECKYIGEATLEEAIEAGFEPNAVTVASDPILIEGAADHTASP
jgi:hypothetical protein